MPDQREPDNDRQDNGNEQRPRRGGNNQQPQRPQQFMTRGAWGWILLGGLLIMLFLVMTNSQNAATKVTGQEFLTFADEGAFVESKPLVVKDERIIGTLKEDTKGMPEDLKAPYRIYTPISRETKSYYLEQLMARGMKTEEEPGGSLFLSFFFTWGPILFLCALIYFFFIRGLRNAGGGPGMLGSFGRSKHRLSNKEHSTVTLDDVAGIEEAKEEVQEIIEFLKNPKKFQRLGGRVPRGVLLIGSPGCGKTLLAKAVAGEADVPFYSISGSDFVEMFVGVGASRVRDLFKQAKDSSPCIIFLDEIDAVGRRRGSGFSSGGHDEREQTLNAILVEMDGFESADQIIVMAATNRADVLDPALTRPGRFDRQIQVPLPDLKGRMEILQVHAKRVKMSPNVDLERLARATPMFSGADLAAIINEAAIAATMLGKDFVEQDDLEEARDKVKFGRSYKSRKIEQDDRIIAAYHEAGHAVVQYLLDDADPLHKVTIIPRGNMGGATFALPEKDRLGYGEKYLTATLRVMCAGRIAEQKKVRDVSSGASGDIQTATAYARAMVLQWGMSERLGFVDYSPSENGFMPEKTFSEQTGRVIDEEVKRIVDEAYEDTVRIINERWDQVVAVAEALLKYETLTVDDVDKLMKGESLSKPTISDLLHAETKKSAAPDTNRPDPNKAGDLDEGPAGAMPSPA